MQLEHVALIVEEYDSAIEFFVETLGFELVEDSPSLTNDGRPKRWVVVRPPGAVTGLLLARAEGDRQRAAVGRQFAGRVGLFLRVEDFAAAYQRMASAGVEFVTAPRSEPDGCGVSRHSGQPLGPPGTRVTPIAPRVTSAHRSRRGWRGSAR